MAVTELGFSESRELLDVLRRVVRERIEPRSVEIDRSGVFPEDIRLVFAGLGLLGITVPVQYGGAERPMRDVVDVIVEIAAACATSANLVTQQQLAIAPILRSGDPDQKHRWLPRLAAGEWLGSFALTESDAGSDNRAMKTIFKRDGAGYRVSGTKVFCTWGSLAQLVTVFGRLESADGPFMAGVVELPADGYEVLRIEEKMGMHASPTAQISFNDVHVPEGNRLDAEGRGLAVALGALDEGRIQIGATAVGIARGALGIACRYLDGREQFGKRLSDFQGLRFKVADHATQIEAAYRLLLAAAEMVDQDRPATRLSAMAKLFATDVAMSVTTDAVGLLGGYGYLREYGVERRMREAKVMQIVEGTNEIQRVVIAREYFDLLRR